MPKKITPKEVAAQFKWAINDLTEFCALVLEEANDHNISLALTAINFQNYELACDFIRLEKDHAEAGELTPELNERRNELVHRLKETIGT